MFSLKNPFKANTGPEAGSTIYPAVTRNDLVVKRSDIKKANKPVKRWELEEGRTRKSVEEVKSQVDASRLREHKIQTALGEAMEDDLPDLLQDLQQAQDQTKAFTAKLADLTAKHNAAKAELLNAKRNAERLILVETEAEAIDEHKALALESEGKLIDLETWAKKMTASEARVLAVSGGGTHTYFLAETKRQFEAFLLEAVSSFIGKGTRPDRLKKYAKFSDAVPDGEYARTRKRT
jgi:hypothetical protein